MRIFIIIFLLCFLPVRVHAPVSDFGRIVFAIETACHKYGVETDKVFVLFWDESGLKNIWTYEKKYKHKVIAHGPGQILFRTAKSKEVGYKGTEKGLDKIEISVPFAVKYLAHLSRAYHGDWYKIISAYKSGKPKYKHFWWRLYPKYLKLSGKEV